MLVHKSGLTFLQLFLLFTCVSSILSQDLDQNTSAITECPTWFIPDQDDPNMCDCGDCGTGNVYCLRDDQVGIGALHCMTYTDGQTLFGHCPYAVSNSIDVNTQVTVLPKNVSELNKFVCGKFNRIGLLCSQCRDNLTLAALSYSRICMECSDTDMRKGIVLFLALAFIPTTAFFLLVMVCGIDISSGPMNAVLIVLQVNLAQINQAPPSIIVSSANSPSYKHTVITLLTFVGIWNLDFLRYVFPSFCISKSLTSLQAQLLEYTIAVYPLFIIIITYILVELHDRGNCLIVILWKPFQKVFRFQCFKDLNVKYSLIKTFATFLLLVYARIFFITSTLLHYNYVVNATGDTVHSVLYMDASITYFSSTHIPYVVLAIIMIVIFNLIPLLLLLLYPTKCFQLFLGCFPNVNWHPLRAFMDIFQGCYKNGTDGTRDYRYFAALNLLVRILILLPFNISMMRLILVPWMFTLMLLSMRPYQKDALNIWDSFVLSMYAINALVLSNVLLYLYLIILFLYLCLVIAIKMMKTLTPACYTKCLERAQRCVEYVNDRKFACSCLKRNDTDVERGSTANNLYNDDEDLPDRINNPQDYFPPLLPASHSSNNLINYGIIGKGTK